MNAIVADGRGRWLGAWGHELESRALEWFAEELNRAGWWRRQLILWRIRRRVAVIVRRNEPSAWTLW
jgi:hypothetical protein